MDLMGIKNKTIWGAVVYPAALPFFDEYLQAIADQDDKDFEVLVFNDGIEIEELHSHLERVPLKYTIKDTETEASPVVNRIRLIEVAKETGANILIIGDCDDTFSVSRVRQVKDAYKRNPDASFFYNDLLYMDGSSVTPSTPEKVESVKDISQMNYLGMSNTTINLDNIDYAFINSLYECDSPIFDWYLHSRLLLNGGIGIKIDKAYTYYRIYGDNIAGVRFATRENLYREVEVKKKHYEMLSKYDMLFKDLLDKYSRLDIEQMPLPEDTGLHYWWDLIRLEEQK